MKYKVGDKVKIKSKEWYEKNKDEDGIVNLPKINVMRQMFKYCGLDAIIVDFLEDIYTIDIDNGMWRWTDEMFEDEKEEQAHIISLPALSDQQALLNQISTLTHTLDVLCTTGHAKSASIVEEKIMGLIEKL